MAIPHPTFSEEEQIWSKGYTHIAGIDEVGRGCFAGPLVAAAVVLPKYFPHQNLIHDSKLLKADLREKAAVIIRMYALAFTLVEIPVKIVNEKGIGEAGRLAFSLCADRMHTRADYFLTDAFPIMTVKPTQQKAIIHGDARSLSIAAASIVAKVYRDSLMANFDVIYPQYKFCDNKGYGTDSHRKAIKQYGLSPLHRTSFDLSAYI